MIKPSSRRLLFLRPATTSSISLISIRSLSTKSIDQSTREAYLERSKEYAGIAFLNLNRPGAKNALSPTLLDQTREALQEVRFDGSVSFRSMAADQSRILTIFMHLIERRES